MCCLSQILDIDMKSGKNSHFFLSFVPPSFRLLSFTPLIFYPPYSLAFDRLFWLFLPLVFSIAHIGHK